MKSKTRAWRLFFIAALSLCSATAAQAQSKPHDCAVIDVKSAPGGLNLYMLPTLNGVPLTVTALGNGSYGFNYHHTYYRAPGGPPPPPVDPAPVVFLAFGQSAYFEEEYHGGCTVTAEQANGQTVLHIRYSLPAAPYQTTVEGEEIIPASGADDQPAQPRP